MLRGALRRGGKIFYKNLFRRKVRQCSYCGDRYTDDQYSSEHKATGHKFNANTDADDGLVEEKSTVAALGHAVLDGDEYVAFKDVCKIDESLVDAEGNAVYAFECERENCPVEVKIDKAGNTAHYVKAAEHKMKTIEEVTYCVDEDSDDKVPTLDDGTSMGKGEGHRYEICENCDTYGKTLADNKYKETVLEPTGHKWNTVQFDEDKSPVVVCEIDEHLTKDAYLNAMKATMGNIAYGPYSATFSAYYGNEGAKYSRYCADCGALQVAEGHDYVVSPLEEGKYDKEDYQKNEDGTPVVAEGVTAATMDCRYVQVCQNEGCGKVLERGQHGKTTAATCREGGHCEVCGEEFSAQLNHTYKSVEDIIKYKDSAKPDEKALYNAYVKVSATETWMTPLDGGCDEKSTTVYVCTKCLTDALDEKNEVVWNQATEVTETVSTTDPTPAPAAVKTNAYVITNDFGHDYVPVYYTLDGQEKVFSQITCAVGFNVKYVCDKCGFVFTNVPVANDPNTAPEEGKEQDSSETNEARNNKTAKVDYTDAYGNKKPAFVYTDADGFVLDVAGAGLKVEITSVGFQADELAALLASKEDNKGDHLVTVASEYDKRNGYVASTCISTAEIPVVCENCGANLSYTYEQLKTGSNNDGFTYVWAEDKENSIASLEDAVNAVVKNENDRKLNYLNHVEGAKIFACGTHCDAHYVDAQGVTHYTCSGYSANHDATVDYTAATTNFANMFNEDYHSTVTISYKLTVSSNYYSDYTIRVAVVTGDAISNGAIDWKKVNFSTDSKLSVCAANKFDTLTQNTTYKAPSDYSTETAGIYFVLTDAEGNNYFVKDFKLYTDDKGETQGTAIEGEGTTTAAQDDTYFLDVTACEAPVHATDEASLEKAITNATPDEKGALTVQFAAGKTITLADKSVWYVVNQKVTDDPDITSLVFDFNGGSVSTGTNIPFDAWDTCKAITFKNGTFNFTNTSGTAITVNSASALTLTFEDVDIVTTSEAISVAYASNEANQSKLILKDSTVTSYGKVGISVDEPTATPSAFAVAATAKPVVTLTNTTVNMTKAPTAPAASQGELAAALVVGAPVYVDVNGGSLIANGQPLVVRGGKVEVSTTSITLNAYNDTRVVVKDSADSSKNQVTWESLFKGQTSAVSTTWSTFVEGVSTVQEYRMAGLWGTGAAVARAAIVVGNSDTSNYDFYANVRLDRVSINVGENEQTIVIGTEYDSTTQGFYSTTTGEGATATTTQNAVVTINATGSALSTAAIAYTNNCYSGTTLTHAANVSLVGFIAD